VNSTANFPTSANFRILIESEIMLVTGVSGTTYTGTRGQESTAAVAHTSGVPVVHILTSGALQQFRSDTILTGTYASLPAAGTAGRRYKCIDAVYDLIDNGSSWQAFAHGFSCVIPTPVSFSSVNFSGCTLDSSHGPMVITNNNVNNSTGHCLQVKSIPSAPYTATFGLSILVGGNDSFLGVSLRESGTGKLVSAGLLNSNGFLIATYNSVTSFAGTYIASGGGGASQAALKLPIVWFRWQDNNSNRLFFYSIDGQNWTQVFSVSRTDFITPDQIGFFCWNISDTIPIQIALYSYQETQP
jgi:hypothetical protein